MSYHNYACHGYLLPATLENADLLGISRNEIFIELNTLLELESVDTIESWWDEAIEQGGYDQVSFTGTISGIDFTVYVIHISSDVEADDEELLEDTTYFSFDPDDLFAPSTLHKLLQEKKMKEYYWVDGE